MVTEDQSQIYLTWDECREAVQGKGKNAKHKSFTDRAEAEEFIAEHMKTKEKDTEENTNAEEQTNNDGEKPEEKENYCLQNCQFDGRDIEGHEMRNCDLCDEWYHISCADLKVDEVQELSAWICKPCKTGFQSYKTKFRNLKSKLLKNEVENLKNDFAILKDKQNKAAILKKDKEHSQEKCEQTNDRPTTNATTQTLATTEESMESQLSTLIKENLQLGKENKEMKDRMTILNRVIEEMLDQQDMNRNSSQVLNERHWEHQSRKGRERKYESRDKEYYNTRNRFQQLADLSDDEFNTQDETVSYHHEKSRPQNTSNFRKVQKRQERK